MGDWQNRQAGSLHAVIIAVLFVALMAALGVVFYQNFIAKKEVVIQQEAPKEEKPLTARVAFNSDIYSLEYPKDWKNHASSSQAVSSATISNPEETVKVVFVATGVDLENKTCNTNDGLKISAYSVDKSPVTKLTEESLYLVETIHDSEGGGYLYRMGLVPDSGATHATIGESHCNVRNVGIASPLVLEGERVVLPSIAAYIIFPKLQSDTSIVVKDMKTIKDMINTQDYRTAVKILKSARKE